MPWPLFLLKDLCSRGARCVINEISQQRELCRLIAFKNFKLWFAFGVAAFTTSWIHHFDDPDDPILAFGLVGGLLTWFKTSKKLDFFN